MQCNMSVDFKNVEKKVSELRLKFRSTDDRVLVDKIEKDLRKQIANAQLTETAPIQALITDTLKKIDDINLMLQHDRDLTVDERLRLMDIRKVHLFWVDRLDPSKAQAYINSLESYVDTKLSQVNSVE